MKRLCILVAFMSLHADGLEMDLAQLQQSLEALNKELPQNRRPSTPTAPDLFEEVRNQNGKPIRPPSPTRPVANLPQSSQEQNEIVNSLAQEFGKQPGYIKNLIQEIEANLARHGKQPLERINLKNETLIRMVRRRLSTSDVADTEGNAVNVMETHDEDDDAPQSTQRAIVTAQDQELVNGLAKDIIAFYKKEFPNISPQIAYDAALHLFKERYIANSWDKRNKRAEQEGSLFIRKQLTTSAEQQSPQTAPTSGLLGSIRTQMGVLGRRASAFIPSFGRTPATAPAKSDDNWDT